MKQCEEPELIRVLVGMEDVGNKRLTEGVGVRKSGHIESDVVSDTVLVNATLSL